MTIIQKKDKVLLFFIYLGTFIPALSIAQDLKKDTLHLMNVSLQKKESSSLKNSKRNLLCLGIPLSVISYGIISKHMPALRNLDKKIANKIQIDVRDKVYLDDGLQYLPLISLYGLDFFSIPAEHSFSERLLLGATSYAIMAIMVNAVKYSFPIERPDGSNTLSFPSGHTANAFTGAHLLYKEYKKSNVWIPIAGYTLASLTGILRVTNNRHWFSDIMAGAAVGIFSVELAYRLLPFWQRIFKLSKNKRFQMTPVIGKGKIAGYVSFRF